MKNYYYDSMNSMNYLNVEFDRIFNVSKIKVCKLINKVVLIKQADKRHLKRFHSGSYDS